MTLSAVLHECRPGPILSSESLECVLSGLFVRSTLTIRGVQLSDEGRFECHASNSFLGQSYNLTVVKTVNVLGKNKCISSHPPAISPL